MPLRFVMAQSGSIGVDVGGTKTLFALFDKKFKVIEEIKIKTQDSSDLKAFLAVVFEKLEVLFKKAAKANLEVIGIGMGIAGSLNPDGSIKDSPNIPFLKGAQIRSTVVKQTGIPVVVENDVYAGVYGEQQVGAAVGHKHVLGVFLGTGLGGALIIDGKLYRGANGCAGDIGHYLLDLVGPSTGSDRHGVLDDIASRSAIVGEAATLAAKNQAPYLLESAGTDVRKIGSAHLAAAIANGDQKIEELVRSRCHILGVAISNLVDFLNPEMVVLGGGLAEAVPAIVREEVDKAIRALSTPEAQQNLAVVVAGLRSHAVTTGAAKLACELAANMKPSKAG